MSVVLRIIRETSGEWLLVALRLSICL